MIKRISHKRDDGTSILVTIKNDKMGTVKIECTVSPDKTAEVSAHLEMKLTDEFKYQWSNMCDSVAAIVPDDARIKVVGQITALLIRESLSKELSEHVYDVSSC